MTTIYILCRAGGSYEDKWESIVRAYTDKAVAEAEVEKQNKHDQYLRDLNKRLQEHMETFVSKLPEVDLPEQLPKKPWPTGLREKDITPEMREERNRIKIENTKRAEICKKHLDALYAERDAFHKKYLLEVEKLSEEDIANNSWIAPDTDVTNYIEETELI